ncbi:MAG: Hpt domain-containing protein [Oscillospiraceae bacterium]|nr:Hpt domain-containing protein [Oscillospiraceae bacterium]MCL2279099.1 Hpt domain-containing protein [Oscillospiraceae bacterium]
MTELTIAGVNVEQGMRYSAASSYENYIQILNTFYEEVKEKLDVLTGCVEKGDLSLYAIHVHAIKSACASIGASEVSQVAEALEMLGKNGELEIIKSSHKEFMKDATILLNNIQQVIKERSVAVVQEDFNDDEITGKLKELRVALKDYDIIVIDQLAEDLHQYTSHPTLGASINEILHNTFITSYDKAIKQIDEIL